MSLKHLFFTIAEKILPARDPKTKLLSRDADFTYTEVPFDLVKIRLDFLGLKTKGLNNSDKPALCFQIQNEQANTMDADLVYFDLDYFSKIFESMKNDYDKKVQELTPIRMNDNSELHASHANELNAIFRGLDLDSINMRIWFETFSCSPNNADEMINFYHNRTTLSGAYTHYMHQDTVMQPRPGI